MPKDRRPENTDNWDLSCVHCNHSFGADTNLEIIGAHFETFHPDEEGIHLNQTWVGIGPSPKPTGTNREARRRQERTKRKKKRK